MGYVDKDHPLIVIITPPPSLTCHSAAPSCPADNLRTFAAEEKHQVVIGAEVLRVDVLVVDLRQEISGPEIRALGLQSGGR